MEPSMTERVTIALIQSASGPDKGVNLERALGRVREAAGLGGRLVCLQELFATEYPCQSCDPGQFALAESVPGPTTEAMAACAAECGVVLVVPLFERRAPGIYHNSAVVIDADGSLLGTYRKMHIPDDPGFHEKYYFAPGDLGFRVWDTAVGRIGVLICWDQWYPEAARLTALQGARLLVYPTAIGWLPGEKAEFGAAQHESWEIMQRAHAIANGCYVAAVNRVGHEVPAGGEGIEFWGQSFVAAPDGSIVARASTGREEIVLAEIDFGALDARRVAWPFFRDRRTDAYGAIGARFLAD